MERIDTIIEKYDFQVKFDGQLHQVDTNLFINSLISLSTIIQEVNNNINSQNKVIIKIEAPERGSFTLLLSLLSERLPELFDNQNINYTANLFDIFIGLYTLKQIFIKNGKPNEIKKITNDQIQIKWDNGEMHIDKSVTYNIYNNSQLIQDSLSKNFETILQDPAIEEFKIYNNKKDIVFEAQKNEFINLSEIKTIDKISNKIEIEKYISLNIFKIVFAEKYKWEFYYKGIKISTFIKDNDFYNKIDEGQVSFAKGDQLVVDLEIEQIFDEMVNTYINHKYTILKVYEHLPRKKNTQISLNINTNLF